ncbi:MAG TPA: CusA/CzcA family heavy metal efflux RND transporter [Pirellulales bacterium]|nr:CusA/CzcA family heavy metal efflux RND transporter [Pirellulales bacterium]
MLERVITWSLSHRAIVIGVALAAAAIGFYSLGQLNVDAFPDTTPVQVQINTVAPAMVPDEIERLITFPIELAMGGMAGLKQHRSISQFGLSQVTVTFEDDVNIYLARQMINERLGSVELPPGARRPEMGPVSTGLGEVFHYLLLDTGAGLTDLRTIQDWKVKPSMRSVAGTAEINSWGGFEKQYQIRIDPVMLVKYDVSLEQLMKAVRGNNLNVGGGNIDQSGDMLLVHGVGRTVNVEQIENIVVAAMDGVPILVRDLAKVVISHEIRRGAVTANGRGEAVLGLGFMLMGENSYAITERMRDKFEEIGPNMPAGAEPEVVYDRTVLVDRVIQTVRSNLFDGALLVITILFIFLGNLRAGLICATAIPLAMLGAFFGMWQLGIAGTLLSLGAIDFGIVVDSSVVVLENIVSHLAHHGAATGASRLEIIRKAAIEVRTPTVFGQVIIMIVYIPIFTLEGVEGKMFRPMALTVVFVLIGSLVLSLTFIPVLASLVLPKRLEEQEVLPVRIAQWLYRPLLRVAMANRFAVLGLAGGALGVALMIALGMGSEFVPRLSEGNAVIGIMRPPGTSLLESVRVNTQMERALLAAFPDEISHVWSRTGAPAVATDAGSIEETDMFVSFTPRHQWRRAETQDQLVELMFAEVGDIPGQTIWFTQPIEQRINEMLSGVKADIALKLFGDDFEVLLDKAQELAKVLKPIPGCVDLAVEQISDLPILQVHIRQNEIARYGVPAEEVLNLVESIGGKAVGEVVEGQLRFPLVIRLPEELRENPEEVGALTVVSATDERIPLSQLADIKVITGPKRVMREWGQRRITVTCNVRGRDMGSFVAEAQQKIDEQVELPSKSYYLEWGGQFENLQRAQKRLTVVVPLALGLIAVLLYSSYRNLTDTLLVFASVPFACVGGILAMWTRNLPLSISAAVGFITLSGVSVLNSMVVVSRLRRLQESGMELRPALEAAAFGCLRTVMMTAMVASVGFVPMATSDGMGAEVQRPLATVVIGGVVSSTLMTLFILPVLYLLAPTRREAQLPARSEDPLTDQPYFGA